MSNPDNLTLADDIERAGWLAIYAAHSGTTRPELAADHGIKLVREGCGPDGGRTIGQPAMVLIEHLTQRMALLRLAIADAIEASDNDGGSASDAIQDMLEILREAVGADEP